MACRGSGVRIPLDPQTETGSAKAGPFSVCAFQSGGASNPLGSTDRNGSASRGRFSFPTAVSWPVLGAQQRGAMSRAVVLVSGGAAVTPFTSPDFAAAGGLPAGNTMSALRSYFL